ncbi:unnamed protein product [Chondrus crispus]|uniref:Bms1-type G domain-containing protein n=1 Tax=Chondrus crispus TaxID=2769 RepID=R7QLS4_CHOCR|nr:unnamed protein product [Chondrus crispus]CDF38733.1 unnamed protein product [Chondrus crispus]|eukprot:XP_005718638.1 unnamed protein product [Chondrus crispus]
MGSRRAKRAHGRVQAFVGKRVHGQAGGVTKTARRLNARAQRKAAIAATARGIRESAASHAPVLVGLVAVSNATDDELATLCSVMQATERDKHSRKFETQVVRREGATDREVLISALDMAKVADIVLFVFSGAEDRLDNLGIDLVTALREQGLPTVFAVAIGKGADDPTLRKQRGRELAAESVGQDHALRPICIECGEGEAAEKGNKLALRRIFAKTPRNVNWRSRYGYMRVESVTAEPGAEGNEGILVLCGWTRGRGFSANELVHITGFGSFVASKIVDVASSKELSVRVEGEAEPVESEAEVNEMMGEQTWPPEVEDVKEEDPVDELLAKYEEGIDDDDDAGTAGADDNMSGGHDAEDDAMADDDMDIDEEEVKRVREAAKTNTLFPDEVDTPINQAARIRFARYRGLKSFRTGEWDPKEQLPPQYASLFQFRNLASTRKSVLSRAKKDAEDAACNEAVNMAGPGRKVYIYVQNVPAETIHVLSSVLQGGKRAIIASGMLRHENRKSVVHFGVRRVDVEDAGDIKAKTHLEMHCGFVRFDGRPMFSEHNANSDKHKMERYLKHGRHTVVTFYGPATYAPAPGLLFHPGGSLIATGTALGADPDRIILKRIILTGYPFKTQKRRTVAKFMFFNPEDVRWFKPVELWTKMGRTGHILEPLGTHGHMKCIFDNVILHHDTVCMTLYKRVYPKVVPAEQKCKYIL